MRLQCYSHVDNFNPCKDSCVGKIFLIPWNTDIFLHCIKVQCMFVRNSKNSLLLFQAALGFNKGLSCTQFCAIFYYSMQVHVSSHIT